MYEALGNREEQELIRNLHPNGKHCDLLRMSPTACDGCPKNPHSHEGDSSKLTLTEEDAGLVMMGIGLAQDHELGVIPDPLDLYPEEYELLKLGLELMKEFREDRLASKIARMFLGEKDA